MQDSGGNSQNGSRAAEILDAARRCFARQGYHQTSIKAIAREAGVRSPSILHYHFQSKEAIFVAVMRDLLARITDEATKLGLQTDGKAPALAAVEGFFSLIDADRELAPLLVECVAMGLRDQAPRHDLHRLLHELEAGVELAIVRLLGDAAHRLPLTPTALAQTVVDLLTGHTFRTALLGGGHRHLAERRGIRTLLGLIRPSSATAAVAAPETSTASTPLDEGSRP